MELLTEYSFFSWFQFSIIALICSLLYYVASRFHLFTKHAKAKSIGFRMFLYVLSVVIVVTFILIHPFYHLIFFLVMFGMFFKNIIPYSRALFSLYYSKVKFGDKVTIGDDTGILEEMNFGGLHLLTRDNKVYFPFNTWKAKKITLESEAGTVLVSFECTDFLERTDYQSINELQKSLFNYPFLAVGNVTIDKEAEIFKVAARISDAKYKSGLESHIDNAGFRLNRNKI